MTKFFCRAVVYTVMAPVWLMLVGMAMAAAFAEWVWNKAELG